MSLAAICCPPLPSSSQNAPVQDLWRKIEAIELSHLGQVRLKRPAQLSPLLAQLSLYAHSAALPACPSVQPEHEHAQSTCTGSPVF